MRRIGVVMSLLAGLATGSWMEAARAAEPGAGPPSGPVRMLSLDAAVALALQNNYDLLLAQERVEEAKGTAFSRLGALFPSLSGSTDYRRLKTFQGEFGGGPVASTPRDIWDARGRLTQPLFSLSLIQQWLAGREGIQVADLDAEVARRDTIATAALFYFEALRAEEAVKAREANLELNLRVLALTEGRQRAGKATGIDILRAKTRVENERRQLVQSRTDRNRAALNLVRALGVPDDTKVVLTDKLELLRVEERTADEAAGAALRNRAELEAQRRRLKVASLTLDSRVSERIPTMDLRGDYGLIGQERDDRVSTYSAGAFLSWSLFDGQREGRISESRSQLRQAQIQARNVMQRVGIEARDAHQAVRLTREQARVAQGALGLALEQLRLSQRAFAIGTLTHLEIIDAQIAIAAARDSMIEALFNFNAARVNLARAVGNMRMIYTGGGTMVREPARVPAVKRVRAAGGGR